MTCAMMSWVAMVLSHTSCSVIPGVFTLHACTAEACGTLPVNIHYRGVVRVLALPLTSITSVGTLLILHWKNGNPNSASLVE